MPKIRRKHRFLRCCPKHQGSSQVYCGMSVRVKAKGADFKVAEILPPILAGYELLVVKNVFGNQRNYSVLRHIVNKSIHFGKWVHFLIPIIIFSILRQV